MVQKTVMLCDKGGEDGANTYTISNGESTWTVELCESHAAPLMRLALLGRQRKTVEARQPRTSAERVLNGRMRENDPAS